MRNVFFFDARRPERLSADKCLFIPPYDAQGREPAGTMRLVHRSGERGHYNSVRSLTGDRIPNRRPRDMGPIPELKDSQLAALCAGS